MAHAGRNEDVSRDLIDGVQHRQILDPLLVEELDEALARTPKLVLGYGCCHHCSAEASIA
jgi:hypothetical protein